MNPRAFCALSPRYLINYHFLLEVFSDHLPQPETSPLKFSHHCLLLNFTTICHYLVNLLTFMYSIRRQVSPRAGAGLPVPRTLSLLGFQIWETEGQAHSLVRTCVYSDALSRAPGYLGQHTWFYAGNGTQGYRYTKQVRY